MGTPVSADALRRAMEKLPPDLRPLLVWLVTGRHVTGSTRNGTG